MSGRLDWIRQSRLTESGLDIYQILNDSSKLIKMRRDEWLSKGRPARVISVGSPSRGGRMKASQALIRYEHTKKFGRDAFAPRTKKVMLVYPEFKWGPYKGRK